MPEYLAPGVYVEEIEIGAKPIEGVSTTTTGFLGMAERGDLNKPTLVTSFAEYQRIFGGYLAEKVYGNKRGLPYAVEGFFVNGGQRLYVSRVATENAVKSSGFLPDISGKSISLAEEVKAKAITLKVKEGATGLKKDDVLLLKDGPQSEYLKFVSTAKALTLDVPLNQSYAKDTEIKKMKQGTTAATTYTIQEDMAANVVVIKLDKVTGLGENDVLLINDPTNSEICIVESVGTTEEKSIEVKTPLRFAHAKNVEIKKLTTTATTKELISVVKAGYTDVPITATDTDFSPDDAIKIGDEYFIIRAAEADKVILIADELKHPHKMDEEIKQLVPAIEVKAVNEGTWGDKIKIVVNESTSSSAKLAADALNQNFLDLDTVTGMEKGTLLKLHTTPLSYETVTEVIKTDDTKRVVLENAVGSLSAGEEVSTVEFDIIVSFDGFDEAFKKLSMNEAHSRHVEKVITPESSKLISVNDVSTTVEASQKIPMPSQDKEPGWKLSGGNDGIPTDEELNTTYEGSDSQEPAERTGLYTFKNIDEISIAAIPGITTQHLQNKLIIHCESMKDRFAVLDSEEKADFDAIQRQGNLYDSKYAALYYPWIRVFDPLSKKRINVSPSGYMCGIYARSDIERGVHKAPANEVVRGALGLEEFDGVKRIITKGQQDILNPKGVNCIRVFPGRGIRVWGARTISSDTLWKYINVRRLFLFLEESIDEGTQWVVFEPNDEKLWARVKQTITQFLTRVWKDGALMGTTSEEAFFVKCDRTTMTQDDIDNGRLIVLIGVAPVKPAEFVIFRIAQWAGGSAVTE